VAYPNSGELWLGDAEGWDGPPRWQPEVLVDAVTAGAAFVGGCCRVSPADIAALARSLDSRWDLADRQPTEVTRQ
jgi:homocysteine S-methyltransferase